MVLKKAMDAFVTMEALDSLVKAGKVRALGMSHLG